MSVNSGAQAWYATPQRRPPLPAFPQGTRVFESSLPLLGLKSLGECSASYFPLGASIEITKSKPHISAQVTPQKRSLAFLGNH